MVFSSELYMLFLIAAILCSFGFYKFVYFISIGYGMAIAGQGIFLLVHFQHSFFITVLQCLVLIVYGIRLAGYLLMREVKSNAYRKVLKTNMINDSQMPLLSKVIIWLTCAILYLTQISPIYFGLYNETPIGIASYIGLVLMIIGVCLECTADYQKSKAKAKNPEHFCNHGLYKIVRCPNYLGEVLLWSGTIITGADTIVSKGQLAFALLGYIGILYVMFSGARRLELRQDKVYSKSKEYREYKSNTPILLPLLPLYSVKNWTWLKG